MFEDGADESTTQCRMIDRGFHAISKQTSQ